MPQLHRSHVQVALDSGTRDANSALWVLSHSGAYSTLTHRSDNQGDCDERFKFAGVETEPPDIDGSLHFIEQVAKSEIAQYCRIGVGRSLRC